MGVPYSSARVHEGKCGIHAEVQAFSLEEAEVYFPFPLLELRLQSNQTPDQVFCLIGFCFFEKCTSSHAKNALLFALNQFFCDGMSVDRSFLPNFVVDTRNVGFLPT